MKPLSLSLTAPAFYERRSCLPQLDCERPHGGDLHPHLFGFRPTFMCYVPSPVLAPVGDTGESRGADRSAEPGSAGNPPHSPPQGRKISVRWSSETTSAHRTGRGQGLDLVSAQECVVYCAQL